MKILKIATLLAVSVLALNAAPTSCSGIYFNNDAPDIINPSLTPKTKELCFCQFATMNSGISKTPLWSAEHLTRAMLSGKAARDNQFHAEDRLGHDEREELSDFIHSSYDRGHLSPSADFINPQFNHECFSLGNMVAQNHNNNAGIWAAIEGATRYLAKKEGDIYVITGPLFVWSDIKRIGGRVFVPTHMFKAIYVPSSGQGAAYITPNAPGEAYNVISIASLEKQAGIRLFPEMRQAAKENAMSLPVPKIRGNPDSHESYSSNNEEYKPHLNFKHFFNKGF